MRKVFMEWVYVFFFFKRQRHCLCVCVCMWYAFERSRIHVYDLLSSWMRGLWYCSTSNRKMDLGLHLIHPQIIPSKFLSPASIHMEGIRTDDNSLC